jgi:hypothetical protein
VVRSVVQDWTDESVPFDLIACPVADTVAVGEDIRIVVLLLNRSPSAVRADAALEPGINLYFELRDPDGEPYEPADQPLKDEPMDVRFSLFPRYGIVGRVMSLMCELPGDVIIPRGAEEKCEPLFELSMPGTYTVRVKAYLHWCRECSYLDETHAVLLEAEPISIVRL